MMNWRRSIRSGLLVLAAVMMLVGIPSVSAQSSGTDRAGDGRKASQSTAVRKDGRELALDGYCPAAYLLYGKAMKGDPKFESVYGAQRYYLSSAEAKKKFDDDPEKFLPQFGGLCTTALGGSFGNRFEGDPEVFDIVDGKLYLFSSERAKRAYETLPPRFIKGSRRLFAEPALGGICPASYLDGSHPSMGKPVLTVVYGGWLYHLSSGAAKEAFEKNPARYLPQYDGFCAEGVARGKRFPGVPEEFVVRDGRIFFFFDDKARAVFLAGGATMIAKADENWPALRKDRKAPK